MLQRYIRIGKRVLLLQPFPEGLCIQEVARNNKPNLGHYFCLPYEPWMDLAVGHQIYDI